MNGQDLSDVPASTQSAETLTVGQEHEGRINFYSDKDWYPVALQANRKYAVEAGNGTAKHLSLTGVYDSGGTEQTIHRVNAFTRYPTGQRAYFTPASAGTYYVGAGVATYAGEVETHRTQETIDGEVVETIHTRPLTAGAYTVSVFDADPETANVSTQASANAGGSYHGEFHPPHNSLTDTDWIKVTMEQHSTYLLLLSGYTSTVNFKIVNLRDSSGNPVSGFTGVNSDRDPQGGGFNSWVDATYTATASGDYFVELTAEAANYMEETVTETDADGVATAGTQALATWDFYGAQYRFRVWSDSQASKGEPSGQDTTGPHVFTDGHVANDNRSVTGSINSAGDVDWYSSLDGSGKKHTSSLLQANDGLPVRFDGMIEWPDVYLRVFDDSKGGSSQTAQPLHCTINTFRPDQDGVHFITLSSQQAAGYSLSIIDLEEHEHLSESGNSDVGHCASPGILLPGDTATGTLRPSSRRRRLHGVDARGHPLPDRSEGIQSPIREHSLTPSYHHTSTRQHHGRTSADDAGVRLRRPLGTDRDPIRPVHPVHRQWQTNPPVDTGTYTVVFNVIGVTNEPDGRDLMPDGDHTAGYLSTQSDLHGTFSEGDYADGFTIDAETGKSYRLTVSERGGTGGYRNIQASIWRHDGTSYTMLDTSYTRVTPCWTPPTPGGARITAPRTATTAAAYTSTSQRRRRPRVSPTPTTARPGPSGLSTGTTPAATGSASWRTTTARSSTPRPSTPAGP